MQILELESRPFHRVGYLNASKRGRPESASLPILRARVHRLPVGVDGILVASDLQGVAADWRNGGLTRLLGEELADVLCELGERGEVPPAGRIGVVLAGDLFSFPEANRRGGHGDVRSVWRAFASRFAWVVGVEGNHDGFGSDRDRRRFETERGVHLLDGTVVDLGSPDEPWVVGGVGSVIGRYARVGRRDEEDFLAGLDLVLDARPQLVVLHEGPNGGSSRQPGNVTLRERFVETPVPLVVCGHSHWNDPIATIERGPAVLNVDARAIFLTE